MSIRRLRTLVAVAEEGTFAGAAQSVFVSQAAVSMQMKSLEQELGAPLFDRKKRPPVLNPLGLVLVPRAREILHAYDEMLCLVSDTRGLAGELTIGAVPTTMTGLVPKAISGCPELVLDDVQGDLTATHGPFDEAHDREPGLVEHEPVSG